MIWIPQKRKKTGAAQPSGRAAGTAPAGHVQKDRRDAQSRTQAGVSAR